MNQYIKVRIRATGQVTEMVPDVARAMIQGGTAEEVKEEVKTSSQPSALSRQPESMAVAPAAERAVAPAQTKPAKKKLSKLRKLVARS